MEGFKKSFKTFNLNCQLMGNFKSPGTAGIVLVLYNYCSQPSENACIVKRKLLLI